MNKTDLQARYFISYTGVALPLNLVDEISDKGLDKRLTYFAAYYDENQRLRILEKVVYGDVEFTHHYEYDESGTLKKAVLILEEDDSTRTFIANDKGELVEQAD